MTKKPGPRRKKAAPVKESPHLRLRVREQLLDRLQRAADTNARTLTNEITRRLEESFVKDDALGGPQTAALLKLFAAELDFVNARYGEQDEAEATHAIARAFANVAVKLLPNLHSVRVAMLDQDGSEGTRTTSYSDKAWEKEQPK